MENTIDLTDARIYVGTYKKYNEGSLFGAWLELADYESKDEFYTACHKLHKDETDPELMFQDYENIPNTLISESWISENLFEMIRQVSDIDTDRREAFWIWCNNGHHDLGREDIDDLLSSFDQDYIGSYDSEEDFARELIEGREDLSDFALQYFDYEAYARDLFLSGYWSDSGYVFYNA